MSNDRLTPWESSLLRFLYKHKDALIDECPDLFQLMEHGGVSYDRRVRSGRLDSICKLEHYKLITERNRRLPNGCPVTRFRITPNGEHYARNPKGEPQPDQLSLTD